MPRSSGGALLRKRDGWAARLRAFSFQLIGEPMLWGRTDCHAFVLQAIDVMTGGDLFGTIRAKYFDVRSALVLWKELGDLDGHLEALGCTTVDHPHFGDIVLYDRVQSSVEWPGSTPALSMMGDRVMLPVQDSGYLGIVPIWAVGHVSRVVRIPCLPQSSD